MFQAGSISKPVAAMAALHLVEQLKLGLDADINLELKAGSCQRPGPGGKPVTLRELLTHTGGTTVHGFPGYATDAPVPTLVQVLNGAKPANTPAIRSEAAPGSKWNYSGGGYTIMQQAMIDVSGQPFPKLLHDTVLAPIGMAHSTYEQPLPKEFQSFAATLTMATASPLRVARTLTRRWPPPAYGPPVRHCPLCYRSREFGRRQGQPRALCTNDPRDAQDGHRLLGPGPRDWRRRVQPLLSHGGVNEGFISIFVAYEKSGEGAVVMTNADTGGALGDEIVRSVALEYRWPDYQPVVRKVVLVDPKILTEYAGTYALAPNFDLVITNENGQLMARQPARTKTHLSESETVFFPVVVEAKIEFFRDAQGKVIHLILHQGGHDMKAPRK